MAKKYRHKKKNTGLVVLIVCVAVVLAGLAAYLITDYAIDKREENTIAACNDYVTEKLGDTLTSVDTYKYSYYGFYITEITATGYNDILTAANAGDEEALEEWNAIIDEFTTYSTEIADIVEDNDKDYTSMVYLMNETSEDGDVLLSIYDGMVYSDGLETAEEETEEETEEDEMGTVPDTGASLDTSTDTDTQVDTSSDTDTQVDTSSTSDSSVDG